MTKMFILLFMFISINFVTSISNQEDLLISNYSHIGCLTLKSDKQFLINYIHDDYLLPYQTFISSNISIDLCFRLCRRWIILINKNHTNCLCLYTINKLYELNEYIGEILPINNCTSNNLEIYSLSNDSYILPSLSSFYDWSLDGCYYLHGIQNYRANLVLNNNNNYIQIIDLCRRYCQTKRNTSFFSFFLSLKKSCYCLPITLSTSIIPIAVRKPLLHCSFLSYIRNGFNYKFNYTEIYQDTVIKIDVQRYCSSMFIFDRYYYLCLKLYLLDIQNTYLKHSTGEKCLPILIKTYKQWKYLLSYTYLLNTQTFIWIDKNSTYILNDLFRSKSNLLMSNDICIVINKTNSNELPLYDLVSCSIAQSPAYTLCAQKPLETVLSDQTDFKFIHDDKKVPVDDNFICPSDFVLFNNMCYYIHPSFTYNISSSEDICSNKSINSTLVKFKSHEWGNINTTRFLGRVFDDILLEFFYYQLEKILIIQTNNNTNIKHSLRLLLGDKTNQSECVLRYFLRSSGAFTRFHQCHYGGYPVCQCEPIENDIIKIISNNMNETKTNSLNTNITIDLFTIEMILTTLSNSINQTSTIICDNNCTNPIPNEDLPNNEMNIDSKSDNNTLIQNERQRSRYPFLLIITGPLLAFVILIVGTTVLIYYIRHKRQSYSTHNSTRSSSQRGKNSSTIPNSDDTSNTPAVLYSRLKSTPSTTMDTDMIHPFDNTITNDENIQLLPQPIDHTRLHKDVLPETDEESLYAIPNHSNEK